MRISGFCISLLVLSFSGLLAKEVSANTCSVAMNLRSEQSRTTSNITHAALIDFEGRRSYWSSSRESKLQFEQVPHGEYSFVVRRNGHMTTLGTIRVSCGTVAQERNTYVWVDQCLGRQEEIRNGGLLDAKIIDPNPNRFTVLGSAEYVCREGREEPPIEQPPETIQARPIPRQISGGVLNGEALSLPKPVYPPAARAVQATGAVSVQVLVDEEGNVISASAVSGHPLLRASAVEAARAAKFPVTRFSGQAVKVSGVITYNVIPN